MKVAVGLFAKPAAPGRVKTRLSPPLSPEACAALYRAFLIDTARICTRDSAHAFHVFSPDPEHQEAAWPEEAPRPVRFRPQRGTGLGNRLTHALGELFAENYDRVLIMGSDHPTLPPSRLADAVDALRWADVVLGPCLDGGYYLIGMARTPPSHFLDDLPWSTPRVLQATLTRAAALGLRARTLRPWYDVDTPADLRRLARELGAWTDGPVPFCAAAGSATARALETFPPLVET